MQHKKQKFKIKNKNLKLIEKYNFDTENFNDKTIKPLKVRGKIQKLWSRRNLFCWVTHLKYARYLKKFYKVNLDVDKTIYLWNPI